MTTLRKNIALLIMATILVQSCVPVSYYPLPKQYKEHVKGATLIATMKSRVETLYTGEIIAVEGNRLYLLPVTDDRRFVIIEKENVIQADVVFALTSNNPGPISAWAMLLNLTPLYQGYFMVYTVPLNLIASIVIATGAVNSTYRTNYPDGIKWEELRKFARFPQGMPRYTAPYDL